MLTVQALVYVTVTLPVLLALTITTIAIEPSCNFTKLPVFMQHLCFLYWSPLLPMIMWTNV